MAMRRRRVMWTGRPLPVGTPAWLLASLILGAFAPAHGAEAAKSPPPATPCRSEPFGSGVVDRVVDGRTLVLGDGREVRLAGIEVPLGADPAVRPEPSPTDETPAEPSPSADGGPAAAAALRALVVGQDVVLKRPKPAADRYGRLLADAYVSRDGSEVSAAKSLVAQGFARVAARPGEAACTADLRAAERTARAAKLGLWGDPRYAARPADNAGEIERGRFTLVEGKVVSVRESGGTIYVNFGRRWSEDFTVTITKRNERMFAAAGLEPQKLAGRRVLVRGWVEERGGPWIEAATPEQIEILDK